MGVRFVAAFVVVACFVLASFSYGSLPAKIATHWGMRGDVDGYAEKTAFTVFLLPAIIAVLVVLLCVLPSLDPLKDNYRVFQKDYDVFILVFTVFLALMFAHTILWNVGYRINPMPVISVGFAALLFFTGRLLSKVKRNWFVGIRTPWTLSSDRVWDETHRVGGRLFTVSALFSLAGAVFWNYAIYLIVVPVILSAAYAVAYSYYLFRKGG